MSKDPAFLFYPNDYMGGTMGMTFEEKGAYIELLMMQFNRGHMTSHMIGQTVGQLWDTVQVKFTQDKKGLWYNERLEFEQEKRKSYTESRNNNRDGANQYSKKSGHTTPHMDGHMENEDVNVIKDKKEIIYPFTETNFIDAWNVWCEYKRTQFGFKYKSISTEQTALNNLKKLSKNNLTNAIEIIDNSISNGWKGFFELEKKKPEITDPLILAVL